MAKRRVRKRVSRRRGSRRRLGVTSSAYPLVRAGLGMAAGMAAYRGQRRNTTVGVKLTGRKIVVGRRKRSRAPAGGSSQLGYRTERFGRKRKVTFKQLMAMTLNRIVYRIQAVSYMGAVEAPNIPGKIGLKRAWIAGAGDSTVPLHLYNLTRLNNTGNFNDIGQPVGYQMKISDVGAVVFEKINYFQNANGVASATEGWTVESGDQSLVQNRCKYVRSDWFDIRLHLHGCTAEPTTFDIMIFTIKGAYKYLDPFEPGSGVDATHRNNFYQSLVRSSIINPIVPGNAEGMRGIRVWRRYRVSFNPSSSDDLNDEPDSKVLKIFFRHGRLLNYDQGATPMDTDMGLFRTGWAVEALTQAADDPPHTSRLYMTIRALNVQGSDTMTRLHTPSYDIMMRKQVSVTLPRLTA